MAPWSTSHGLLAPYVALPARGEGTLAQPGPAEPLWPPHVSKAGTRLGVKRASQAVSRRPKIVDTDTPTPDFAFGEDPAPPQLCTGLPGQGGLIPGTKDFLGQTDPVEGSTQAEDRKTSTWTEGSPIKASRD